jgi:hypothetical protein
VRREREVSRACLGWPRVAGAPRHLNLYSFTPALASTPYSHKVKGLGFRVEGLGFRVLGLGFRV